MAPIKRKGNAPEENTARQPQKRAKVGAEEVKKDHKKSNDATTSTAGKASELSVLRDDEPSFPRGGASVLTPLERKQIQIQANRDVLFEQKESGNKKLSQKTPSKEFAEESDDDVEMEDEETTATTKKSRKKKSKGKKSADKETDDKQNVRIEGLSFKRIVPGAMILGQVSSINAHDIGLSLPNNLTGYVPLTAVSKGLEDRLEKMLNDEGEDDDAEDSSDDESFDLKDHFYLGQYLRAFVVSTGNNPDDPKSKSKKRIELSVDPRQTNTGFSKSDLVVNSAVQASVVSVEDHGVVMDLGIEGSELKGFMSSKETDPSVDYSSIKEGSVFLCMVTGQNPSGNVIKLSSNFQTSASIKKSNYLSSAPTINTFLPGTAAEILLTEVTSNGMIGKIMGMLDATVDLVQSSINGKIDLEKKYKIGAKIKGRIISTFPAAEPLKVSFSMLDHVLKLSSDARGPGSSDDAPAISAIIPEVKVVKVDHGLGVYARIGETKHMGFVHMSRLSDGKVETIDETSGAFQLDAVHEARVIGYNSIDNLYILSFEKSVIEQPFLRVEDVNVGAIVKGKVEKLLIGADGMNGLIVNLADGITGLVPSMHFADTMLQFPEKKFREGQKLSLRILSVNLEKRQIRLTLKKSLLNSESTIWKDYKDITPSAQSPGTIVNLQSHGAVVQFYGEVRGFLPVSEMSEAYIQDPAQHFRLGQVVNVHALSVDASLGRLAVSCKDPSTFTEKYREAFENLHPGHLVTGVVFEKSNDDVLLKLDESGLVARLDAEHLIDGPPSKQNSMLSKLRVGQKLNDLLVLNIQRAHRLIKVSSRASLKKAAKQKNIPGQFEEVQEGSLVTGFIRNITPDGVFVEFLGGLTGLLPKRLIEDANLEQPHYGLSKAQTIVVNVQSVDQEFKRFILSMKPVQATQAAPKKAAQQNDETVTNPVDENIKTMSDFTFGRIVECKVVSIKATQVNVQLADNIQGRIDVSEIFDDWKDIKDRKQPLRFFKAKQTLSARILGVHDARNHKFLPISHRTGKYPVFELSLKPSYIKAANPAPLNMEQVQVGSFWTGFVNNVADDCLWVNLSPNVRGRLRFMDASDDLSLLTDIEKNFPIGSALKVQVTAVNAEKGHLNLSAKQGYDKLTFADISVGMILPGRVTKVTERQLIMQLGESLVGAVNLIDLADDYSKANPTVHNKNEVLRACVIAVDKSNKKIALSLRPSKVMSSSLPVQDREISSLKDVKPNDIVRGFVRRVTDSGLFVAISNDITAYVRVSDLSDSYLKEWKDSFQPDQLVKGKVTFVDAEQGKLQLSLKESVLDPNFKAPITLKDLKVGQIVTGKVRKVEEFGAFVVVDGSSNISGLCHRSEMAEKRVEDARKLYDEGDAVKAKVIKIDLESKKISFSLKASHFQDEEEDDSEDEDSMSIDGLGGVELGEDDSEDEDDDDESMGGVDVEEDSEEEESEDEDEDVLVQKSSKAGGLGASGFDWSGTAQTDAAARSDSEDEDSKKKKKKNRKAEIQVDRTGDLDANGPQSVADFERLLLGEPDSSLLWLQYMAFQLELGEIEKARAIAERALRTITMGQDAEKLNIWVALLNMENTYGDDDSLEEVFKRACQYNDPQEIYERMISIYIQSGKNQKASDLFYAALKKKVSSQSPKFFYNYASFLFDTMASPDRARALLPRALQSLPAHTHVETTSKFAQLEFRSANGDVERGRTVFEGLLSSFPKRIDLWNVLLDLEIKVGDAEQVRRLFERVLGLHSGKKGPVSVDASKKLKPKQARFLFKKWLSFEEGLAADGDEKMVEEVKARAVTYVKSLQEDSLDTEDPSLNGPDSVERVGFPTRSWRQVWTALAWSSTSPELSEDSSKRKRSCQSPYLHGLWRAIIGIFIMLGIIQFISITCGIVLSFFPDEYDRAVHNWLDSADSITTVDNTRWPTDISRDIVPVSCHSHNDYWHRVPLYSALQAGCIGVEADVWLFDDELYVGHSTSSLTERRTLQSMYIDPLVTILERQNPTTKFTQGGDSPAHGVFDTDPAQSLILLIDFKTAGPATWHAVMKQLAPLRDRGYLTHFNGVDLIQGPVTVVGTGNTPFNVVTANTTYRDIFFDAPLDKLVDADQPDNNPHPDAALIPGTDLGQGQSGMPAIITASTFNTSNSFYASVSFKKTIGRPWPFHFTQRQMDRIRSQVRVAHQHGLKVRYWALPSWPHSLRNHVWRVLAQEGVDVLNVDDLVDATKGDWNSAVFDWWP
ncbi:Nucleic acid-binding, OB-fold [Penicillium expansum]|uniref:rRNA biogenesis protein RRP5 n=1 Tax=Penicillium expansum TaxID=27334 RepID=A0A0A2JTN9_PENEN|nr:Nucleic acid-binding, OB-fold [Penicillium expansum]KGO58033.1 Nucleic acid-binding, OB-fold [Penicillium expansum]